MSKKSSKLLVIDASIARSAGETQHPVSKCCRDTLVEILEVCHKIVMTQEIKEEWKKHRSRFAATWLSSMVARKKLINVEAKDLKALFNVIDDMKFTEGQVIAIRKDFHLVEAALVTDKTILSLDNALKSLLRTASTNIPQFKQLMYINPTMENQEVLTWIRNGANHERTWLLAFEQD
jgi:hypothetical protein